MPAKGFKLVIEGTNPEIVADIGGDVVIARHNAAPTSGAAGTLAGQAGPGSLLLTSTGAAYLNTGTKDAPNWVQITAA